MKKIELKARAFAKDYVATNFNGTEAAARNYNVKNRKVAGVIAVENLAKPSFQKSILEVLEEEGIDRKDVGRQHKIVLRQNKNYPAKNTAIDMYYKLSGDYAPEKKANFNLNLTNEQLNARLNELDTEIKRIKGNDTL